MEKTEEIKKFTKHRLAVSSMAENKTENPKCSECSHKLKKRCRFGATLHCTLDGSMMDVTEIVEQDGRTLLCPLLRLGNEDANIMEI